MLLLSINSLLSIPMLKKEQFHSLQDPQLIHMLRKNQKFAQIIVIKKVFVILTLEFANVIKDTVDQIVQLILLQLVQVIVMEKVSANLMELVYVMLVLWEQLVLLVLILILLAVNIISHKFQLSAPTQVILNKPLLNVHYTVNLELVNLLPL